MSDERVGARNDEQRALDKRLVAAVARARVLLKKAHRRARARLNVSMRDFALLQAQNERKSERATVSSRFSQLPTTRTAATF